MLVGFAKDDRARKVIGIDASFTPAQTKAQVLDIARNTAALVELGREIVEDDCVLIEDYAYPAYGVPSEETKEAIRLCARLEGMRAVGRCLMAGSIWRSVPRSPAPTRAISPISYYQAFRPSKAKAARSCPDSPPA